MGEVGLENKEREQTNIYSNTTARRKIKRPQQPGVNMNNAVCSIFALDTRFIGRGVFSHFYPPEILAIFLSKKVRS